MFKFPVRIAVVGSAGRIGKELIREIYKNKNIKLTVALERKRSKFVGVDVGELVGFKKVNVLIIDNLKDILNDFDMLIDVSSPIWDKNYLLFCVKHNKSMIIVTTSLKKKDINLIKIVSKKIPIILSTNFSIGLNLILKLIEKTSKVIGNFSDIEIIDFHHKSKKDSPSGTSLSIGKIITQSIETNVKNCIMYDKFKKTKKRKINKIGFSSIRSGNTIGEHTVIFSMDNERIEIVHRVFNKKVYVFGIIRAIFWLIKKKNGFFSMIDVLDLKKI